MPFQAKLISVSYPSDNPQTASQFYGALLGNEFARSLTDQHSSYHSLVSAGVQLTLDQRHVPGQHNAICHFRVTDLNAAIHQLQQHGGKTIVGPLDMPLAQKTHNEFKNNYTRLAGAAAGNVTNTMGKMVIMADPDGNHVGLVQLEDWAHVMFQRGDLNAQDEQEHQTGVATGKKL